MIASVRDVTDQAIFLNGGVLPKEGPSFLRVALVAEFIGGVRRDHLRPETAMRFMAVGAFDLSLPDGMVGLLVVLGPDAEMADQAEVRLSCFEVLRGP